MCRRGIGSLDNRTIDDQLGSKNTAILALPAKGNFSDYIAALQEKTFRVEAITAEGTPYLQIGDQTYCGYNQIDRYLGFGEHR